MKNPSPYIRTELVRLLDGTITYQGNPVPCFEGEGEVVPFAIYIADQDAPGRNNSKHSFDAMFTQTIEIVSRQQTNLRKHVDAIGSEVMNLIKPTPLTKGINDSADFQIMTISKTSQNYLPELEADNTWINRLILRYSFLIVEK